MAQPARKPNRPRSEPSLERNRTKKEDAEIIELRVAANDNEDEEKFLERTEQELERELGKGRPLEVHMRDIKALRAFRNAFSSIKHADPEDLNFYVIHPDFDVSVTRAFGLKNSENVTLLAGSRGERHLLEEKGYDAVKGSAEKKQLSEKQDIVIVMDTDVRATPRLLRNVAPGGWILWPVSKANALRGMGKYKCMGLIEKGGSSPAVRDVGEDFWKKAEVETDEDLQHAPEEEGVVTYEEAARAVWDAYGTKDDIVKHYKQLITLAEAQHGPAIADGTTEVVCTLDRNGKTIEVPVNVLLPFRAEEFRAKSDEDLAIFKKREFV